MMFRNTFIGILIVLAIWEAIAMAGIFSPIFFASPLEVFREAPHMIHEKAFQEDVASTIGRVLASLAISAVIGIPIGIAIGYFARFYSYFTEILDFFRSIPPIVIYPLLMISLGPGDVSRIGTAVFGSIAVILLLTSKGVYQQDSTRRDFYKSRGATTFQIIREIVVYEGLPHIMTGLRTAASLSLIVIIVTEMLFGGESGLGARVQQVQITSNIPDLFFTIIVIGLLGLCLNKLLIYVEERLVTWKS